MKDSEKRGKQWYQRRVRENKKGCKPTVERVFSLRMGNSFIFCGILCSLFVLVQFLCWPTRRWIKIPSRYTEFCRILNNCFYSLASLTVAILTAFFLLSWLASGKDLCQIRREEPVLSSLLTVFHLSKYWEMQDVIWWMMSGKIPSSHFLFHHNTTPLVTLVSVSYGSPALAAVAMFLNSFLHSMLYAYLSGEVFSFLFWPTRIMGFVQLLGVLFLWMRLGDCGGESWANSFATIFYLIYLTFFIYEVSHPPKKKDQ
eukprot:TRINITY_DN4917_c0_g1_i5.p1 TRINITY_DN4917_c0_g1~~TRINITY_DN4917_c0_g1_i5.p1  ORF type:complete len:257 (+),score=33.21 TRINITY_DN4917_c0_g1_i5:459-1229(+)